MESNVCEDQKLVNVIQTDDHRIEVSNAISPRRIETTLRVWLIDELGCTSFKSISHVHGQHHRLENSNASGFRKLGREERPLYEDKMFKYFLEVAESEKCIQLSMLWKQDNVEYCTTSIPNVAGEVEVSVTKDSRKISELVVRKVKNRYSKEIWVIRKF